MKFVRAAVTGCLTGILLCTAEVATTAANGEVAGQQLLTSVVYYVDPLKGKDTATGLSTRAPLRTLTQVAQLDLRPGDRVRLRAGVIHQGSLTAWQSGTALQPIVVSSYGTGGRPIVQGGGCVQVPGHHWRITSILAKDCAFAGFQVGGDHVKLRNIEATGNVAGVLIEPTSAHAVVRASHIHGNTRMAPDTPGADDDYGANGVVVSGTAALITDNVIEGHRAPSADYGHDGAAVEIYGATATRVFRNRARDNLVFVELGHSSTTGAQISYNAVSSVHPAAYFLITRGESAFGPVNDTVATHNSVRLTGRGSMGISCHPNCTPTILKIGSNVIQAADAGYAEAPDGSLAKISTGYNVYEDLVNDGWHGLHAARTDVRAAVLFDAADGGFRLRAMSPAVDIGGPFWLTDILFAPTPVDGNADGLPAADAGAFERPAAG